MAGGKETPRQKMIGMMYLVLTALLALNVSKEILNAFVIINDGLETTNANFEGKNGYTYAQFEKAYANDPDKVRASYEKAKNVRNLADELDVYVDNLKRHLIAETEGFDLENEPPADSAYFLKNVNSKDAYDRSTNILIGENVGDPRPATDPWSAMELQERLKGFETSMVSALGAEVAGQVNVGFDFSEVPQKEGPPESWESSLFYHLPLAAVITNLTKIQADVRNMEAEVIKTLLGNIGADDFKFDTLAAKIIPNTNYLILGDTFRADVFVAAFSTTQDPVLEVSTQLDTGGNILGDPDTSSVSVENGVAIYTSVPKAEGLVEWGGIIKIKSPDGTYKPYKFKSEFMVAKPALVVSPTAMNVFYRGLENPVEVSVPGVPTEKLEVSVSNASKSGSKGKFMVKPGSGTKCEVSVSAELNGSKKNFGKMEFRVKNVPDPKPYFAGVTGAGNVQRKNLIAAQGVIAKMENFEFDLRFDIVSYVMSATIKGKVVDQPARGPRVTANMKTLLGALRPGQKIYIEKIKAKGPDGTVRDLGTIVLKVI